MNQVGCEVLDIIYKEGLLMENKKGDINKAIMSLNEIASGPTMHKDRLARIIFDKDDEREISEEDDITGDDIVRRTIDKRIFVKKRNRIKIGS